jgi:hypothetical protein
MSNCASWSCSHQPPRPILHYRQLACPLPCRGHGATVQAEVPEDILEHWFSACTFTLLRFRSPAVLWQPYPEVAASLADSGRSTVL